MAFPIYRQLFQMDCGAACVKMICDYHNKQTSIEKIRELCSVGREGVSFKGICNALEDYGFKTVAGKITRSNLDQKATLPCILHWDQNHFVVLYRVKLRKGNNKYYIADPGSGLVVYSQKEFEKCWISTRSFGSEDQGSIIMVEPGPDFIIDKSTQEGKRTISEKIRFLWSYFKSFKRFFLQLFLGIVACSLIILITPFLTQSIVDIGIGNKSIEFILFVLLGQTVLLIGRTAIDFIQTRMILHIGSRINIALLSDFFIKLMRLPLSFFDTRLMGDTLQRLDDHRRIEDFLTSQTIGLFLAALTFLAFGTVLFIYDIKVFIVFIVFSLVYGIWLSIFLRRRRDLNYKYFDQQAKNQSVTYQLIDSIQETKLQNAEKRKRWEWEDVQVDMFYTSMEILKVQQSQSAGGIFINELRNIIITVMTATNVITGVSSIGTLVAIQFIVGQLFYPIEKLMSFLYQWQDVSISIDRIGEIHGQDNESEGRDVITMKEYDHTIHITDMSFKYPGIVRDFALQNINLDIPAGKTTAIVGASGSGKSTLMKLLLGYYLPTNGDILLGDVSLRRINMDWWHSQCGIVMQNGFIYADTIAGNIAVAELHPDVDDLEYASDVAHIDEFVQQLPFKYNTKIGDGGQDLSQGQKQRLLIARAIYKDPEFMFLDEATNSLDANTEKMIVSDLDRFYDGRTVVIIAHRLSTVKNADQIIVLEKGRIVECGNHESLVNQRGHYYSLIKNQLELGS